jgi:hypothetical protein
MVWTCVDYDIAKVSEAGLYADGYEGCARMVVDKTRNLVVGATLVHPAVTIAGQVRLWQHAYFRTIGALTGSVGCRNHLPNVAACRKSSGGSVFGYRLRGEARTALQNALQARFA